MDCKQTKPSATLCSGLAAKKPIDCDAFDKCGGRVTIRLFDVKSRWQQSHVTDCKAPQQLYHHHAREGYTRFTAHQLEVEMGLGLVTQTGVCVGLAYSSQLSVSFSPFRSLSIFLSFYMTAPFCKSFSSYTSLLLQGLFVLCLSISFYAFFFFLLS